MEVGCQFESLRLYSTSVVIIRENTMHLNVDVKSLLGFKYLYSERLGSISFTIEEEEEVLWCVFSFCHTRSKTL